MITRRRFLKICGGLAGVGAGVGLYTWRVEPHWLEIVERPLPIANLPSSLVGARLAQLSDLHVGPRVDDDYLLRSFARVRALDPEFVAYTGDFISHEPDDLAHASRVLAQLPLGRLGTVGILGNHDYGPNWAHPEIAAGVTELVTAAGVRMLRNETADIGGLRFVGLDDLWSGYCRVGTTLAGWAAGHPGVVLAHNPDIADLIGWGQYSGWILAGHTHGGQYRPPFLPPPLLPVKNRRYTAGEFDLGEGRRMYVNRGVGHLLRVRFNVRPEITLFRLAAA